MLHFPRSCYPTRAKTWLIAGLAAVLLLLASVGSARALTFSLQLTQVACNYVRYDVNFFMDLDSYSLEERNIVWTQFQLWVDDPAVVDGPPLRWDLTRAPTLDTTFETADGRPITFRTGGTELWIEQNLYRPWPAAENITLRLRAWASIDRDRATDGYRVRSVAKLTLPVGFGTTIFSSPPGTPFDPELIDTELALNFAGCGLGLPEQPSPDLPQPDPLLPETPIPLPGTEPPVEPGGQGQCQEGYVQVGYRDWAGYIEQGYAGYVNFHPDWRRRVFCYDPTTPDAVRQEFQKSGKQKKDGKIPACRKGWKEIAPDEAGKFVKQGFGVVGLGTGGKKTSQRDAVKLWCARKERAGKDKKAN